MRMPTRARSILSFRSLHTRTSLLYKRAAFVEVYDELRREIVDEILPAYGLPKEVAEHQAEMLDYNVPGGKLNRGLSVVHA